MTQDASYLPLHLLQSNTQTTPLSFWWLGEKGAGGLGRLSLLLRAETGLGVRAVLVPRRDSSAGRDACSIASVLCKGASASLYVTLCTDNQRSCLFSEHCLALTAVSRRYTRSTATWQHRAPCKLPVICATADARIHSLALCRAMMVLSPQRAPHTEIPTGARCLRESPQLRPMFVIAH